MPIINTQTPKKRKRKNVEVEWEGFKDGLNLYSRPTELKTSEMAQADNIVIEGSGTAKGRWGTSKYFSVNTTGVIRGFGEYKDPSTDISELLSLTDEGYLAKRDGTSYERITGQSWPSGSKIHTEQLGGETFIASEEVSFTKYDGTDLTPYPTLSKPTGLAASNVSGVTGGNVQSYRVVALSGYGGYTEASDNILLENLPFELTETRINLTWNAVSASTLAGYEIYRGPAGYEGFLAGVGPDITEYTDVGGPESEIIEAPIVNTTGGVKAKCIAKYKDRILLVPAEDPTKIMISGKYPNHTSFSFLYGGGYVYVDPDGGEEVNGIAVQPTADRIVAYKDHSSYLIEITLTQVGNYFLLDPQYQPISTSVGCSNQDTIATVENDTFYFGRDGIYVTGYEPNFLNIIRTNEVSARIRPYFEKLSEEDYSTACAAYIDNKYILSFPKRREMVVYDRERGCFAGIWKVPYGISYMRKFYEDNGSERWVLGSDESNQVYVFEKSVNNDDGEAITKTLKTNKEDFGDWTLLSIIKYFYVLFKDITGETNVNIIIEDRDGNERNIKTFTISGSEIAGVSGYGIGSYGEYPYGITADDYSTSTNEATRWGTLFKQARLVQLEVSSNANSSNFELLKIKMTASKQSEGSLSANQRV